MTSRSRQSFAFDACAVIAFLAGEEGADRVEGILAGAGASGRPVLLHRANLGEVYYLKLRSAGAVAADELLENLRALPIVVSDVFDARLMRLAAELKVGHRLAYLDAIAAAWASLNRATLVTTDRRGFRSLERAGAIAIEWVR